MATLFLSENQRSEELTSGVTSGVELSDGGVEKVGDRGVEDVARSESKSQRGTCRNFDPSHEYPRARESLFSRDLLPPVCLLRRSLGVVGFSS